MTIGNDIFIVKIEPYLHRTVTGLNNCLKAQLDVSRRIVRCEPRIVKSEICRRDSNY